MARTPYTRKPCHGCGEVGYRDPDKVCRNCQQLLDEARAERDRQKQDQSTEVFGHQDQAYTYLNASHHYVDRNHSFGERTSDRLQKAMNRLINVVGEPANGVPAWQQPRVLSRHLRESIHYPYAVRMKPAVREAIDALDQLIVEGLDVASRGGFYDGTNTLEQLSAGIVSIADFEKRKKAIVEGKA
jgi:hypothetical protein